MAKTFIFFPLGVLLVHCIMPSLAMASPSITTDEIALLALKASITLDKPHNNLTSNWSASTSPCDWIGVTCSSRHQRVTALNISNLALSGSIPPQLGNLSFLVSLDVSRNSFHGRLPQELVHLRRLRFISFAVNKFSGEIPSLFGFLGNLQYLILRNNSLSGFLPVSLSNASRLQTLDLRYNSLEGMVPKELGFLPNLKNLVAESNRLSGPIPSTIFNISTLEIIAFTDNTLSGSLPDDICNHLSNLTLLYLSANELGGQIPSNFVRCSKLQVLSIAFNKFEGSIPREIGKLENLRGLSINRNNLTGEIPEELGNMQSLTWLRLDENRISGSIPLRIFNMSMLQELTLSINQLTGPIPWDIGRLAALRILQIGGNNMTGVIPEVIGNLSQLEILELAHCNLAGSVPVGIFNTTSLTVIEISYNYLTGRLPDSMGYGLPNLEQLNIGFNNLSGVDANSISDSQIPVAELSFITSLTSCKNLQILAIGYNPLNGVLPKTIGQFPKSLVIFRAMQSKIKGSIPDEIGNLSSLVDLYLNNNELIGVIPATLQGLENLQRMILFNNQIRGSIPRAICNLQNLGLLDLNGNQLSGSIPECLGRVTSLRYLHLVNNRLTSAIPSSLWDMQNLLELNLSSNFLTGTLPPEISNLGAATSLDLSLNYLSGSIPGSIGSITGLAYFSLAHNRLQGPIPESIGSLLSLVELDLSQNNLSGAIPKSLEALRYLTYFNVSFNNLSGEIPSGGPFKNFTGQSFISNEALCGDPKFHVRECRRISVHISRRRKVIQIILFALAGVAGLFLTLTLAFLLYKSRSRRLAEHQDRNHVKELPAMGPSRFSYYELLQATEGYTETNLLGTGSFGSVYKGTLKDGMMIAIKVFNLQMEDAFKSFDIECEVLRNLRHRNLTKVLGSCSNKDFKALVLEYMPNGSLEKWLYSENHSLDMVQRMNIMIDVACALEYLHHSYSLPVAHCDLKPSNVLLDGSMVAHLTDFGVAKLLGDGQSFVHTKTLATFGYMAPEFGQDGLVSTRCDIYSFGIMLMETFTGRKPSDEMFNGDLSLKQWVCDSLPDDSTIQIVDPHLIRPEDEHFIEKLQCVKCIMELALNCSAKSPRERIGMKDVVVTLKNIKLQLLARRA